MRTQQLATKLKALRLGGMLDSLDTRLEQAQHGHHGYLVFLEWLLEDELQRRHQKALSLRLKKAQFDEVRSLAEFDFRYNPKLPAELIRDLASCGFVERAESVVICGPVGVGKSHVAQALGYAACQRGYRVRYVKTNRMLGDLAGGRLAGNWGQRLQAYIAPDLLILDDFGLRDFDARNSEDLFELVCERHRKRSTVIVSNRPTQEWYALFANPVLAEGTLDRLINSSHYVLMDGRSYRPRGRPDRAPGGETHGLT
jgi:DNA replication protein DnaC